MKAQPPNTVRDDEGARPRRFKRGTIEIIIACALTLAALIYIGFTSLG